MLFKKISDLKKELNEVSELKEELDLLIALSKETDVTTEINALEDKLKKLEVKTFLNGKYDNLNCYIEIHPGAGGTESCDWSSMLLDMYSKYCNNHNYEYEIIYLNKGEEAGIKDVTIKVTFPYAYGYLKNESGVHRLVRISPFDSNKRRHTSFASVIVTPEFDNDINIEIKEEDLKIDVYHSSGAGGQSVNTSNSAVRITHLPTKLVVTCQNERSQLKNKDMALKMLKNKLYEIELSKQNNLEDSLKNNDSVNFGSQIRSYFLEPYKLVKDHRSDYESPDPLKILDGYLDEMLEYNLKNIK